MPMRHGGSFAKKASTCRRFSWRRTTTCPAASTPCTWKTDFAMSRPIVAIVCIGSSSESWEPQGLPTSLALSCRGGAVHSIKSGLSQDLGQRGELHLLRFTDWKTAEKLHGPRPEEC